MAKYKEVTSDSSFYCHTFYGVLNAQGDLWSPMPFDSESAARAQIERTFFHDKVKAEQCLRTNKIVPVRVRLTTIDPSTFEKDGQ